LSKIYDALERCGSPGDEQLAKITASIRQPRASGASPQAASETIAVAGLPADWQIPAVEVHVPPASPLLPFDGSDDPAAEQYRIIRTKISQNPAQPRVVAISSPSIGDGKSVSSINLAVALSLKGGEPVLLIDADLRRPNLARLLGLHPSRGLTDVLAGRCRLDEAIVRLAAFSDLCLLPAGPKPSNPTELLDSSRLRTISDQVRQVFRFVVFDAPPVGLVADFDLVQAVTDGVIVIVRPDHTDRSLCHATLEAIPGRKLLGVVMNCIPDSLFSKGRHSVDYCYSDSGVHDSGRSAVTT
jgi:capsular exopolysaccharide synthesis family protein